MIYIAHKIINIEFRTQRGTSTIICLSEDCPIRIAIIYYFIRMGGFIKDIFFSYNEERLGIDDKNPIKKIFNSTIPIVKVLI